MVSFKFIDLFAGIGGIRLGFEKAGGKCVWSSEYNKYAQLTYNTNFKEIPHGDITQISADQIPPFDILCAGFPCQPFSIAGVSKKNALGVEHGFKDKTQGTLFFDIARIIEHHKPKAFFLENVKNLKHHDKGNTYKVIKETLEKDLGYKVFDEVINAKLLVPQYRDRIYIVGFRDQSIKFQFPKIKDKKPILRDILERNVDDKYTLTDNLWKYLQEYKEKHRKAGNGFGYGLADLKGISRTLSARYYKDGAEILIPQKGKNPRRLTPRECARLQGYPESFKIPVSDTQAYKQFGNSVAVPIIRMIASSMVKSGFLDAEAKGCDRAVGYNDKQEVIPETQTLIAPPPTPPLAEDNKKNNIEKILRSIPHVKTREESEDQNITLAALHMRYPTAMKEFGQGISRVDIRVDSYGIEVKHGLSQSERQRAQGQIMDYQDHANYDHVFVIIFATDNSNTQIQLFKEWMAKNNIDITVIIN